MLTYSNGQTVSITPDKGKIDVSITYPWASRTSTRANPQLAIIVAAAGRAGSGGVSGSVQVNGNSASLTWNSGVSATLFSWDTNAYIAAQANAVTSVTITAQQLDAYKCNSLLCIGIGDLLALSWKLMLTYMPFLVGIPESWSFLGPACLLIQACSGILI